MSDADIVWVPLHILQDLVVGLDDVVLGVLLQCWQNPCSDRMVVHIVKAHHAGGHRLQQVLVHQWFGQCITGHAFRWNQHDLPHLAIQSGLLDAEHIEALSLVLWQGSQSCHQFP